MPILNTFDPLETEDLLRKYFSADFQLQRGMSALKMHLRDEWYPFMYKKGFVKSRDEIEIHNFVERSNMEKEVSDIANEYEDAMFVLRDFVWIWFHRFETTNIARAVRYILKCEHISSRTGFELWCGEDDRKKLYDRVRKEFPVCWNTAKYPEHACMAAYQRVLAGYKVYKKSNRCVN
jgi:hypothetical protein